MNEDSLLPMIDDMLHQREIMCENLNKKFGTNISVELSSSWKKIRKEIALREEQQEKDVSGEENDDANKDE